MIAVMPAPDGTQHFVTFRSVVLGVPLDLFYRWNSRTLLWTLDVDIEDVPLVTGQVVRPNKDLLARGDVTRKPAVEMRCFWAEDPDDLTTPGLTDLADRAMVVVYDGQG